MLNTFYAKKTGMTGKYTEDGSRLGATVLSIMPMTVAMLRKPDKNGYSAVQFNIKLSGRGPKEANREIRTSEEELSSYEVGQEIAWAELIKAGDKVNVSGISKGHGFAGVVKRYNFKGGPRTHGQSNRERSPGSSGPTTTPGRVLKGKRRSGHMGTDTIMVKNLRVLEVNPEQKQIVIAGSVPGAYKYTLLKVSKSV